MAKSTWEGQERLYREDQKHCLGRERTGAKERIYGKI